MKQKPIELLKRPKFKKPNNNKYYKKKMREIRKSLPKV